MGYTTKFTGDGSVDRYDVTEIGDHYGNYNHDTLAAALEAASKEHK